MPPKDAPYTMGFSMPSASQQLDRVAHIHAGVSGGVDRHLGQAVLAARNE
jgi:hypothetical protein